MKVVEYEDLLHLKPLNLGDIIKTRFGQYRVLSYSLRGYGNEWMTLEYEVEYCVEDIPFGSYPQVKPIIQTITVNPYNPCLTYPSREEDATNTEEWVKLLNE